VAAPQLSPGCRSPAGRAPLLPDFYEKYRAYQARVAALGSRPATAVPLPPRVAGPTPPPGAAPPSVPPALRDLPTTYNERYRLNFAISTAPLLPVWTVTPSWDEQAKDFRNSIHLFEDFLQKKRFAQLRKTILVRGRGRRRRGRRAGQPLNPWNHRAGCGVAAARTAGRCRSPRTSRPSSMRCGRTPSSSWPATPVRRRPPASRSAPRRRSPLDWHKRDGGGRRLRQVDAGTAVPDGRRFPAHRVHPAAPHRVPRAGQARRL